MAWKTMVMNVNMDGDEINLIKDTRARSYACYKFEEGHFQRDCKYDGDKPTDGQQAQGDNHPLTPMILWWESG